MYKYRVVTPNGDTQENSWSEEISAILPDDFVLTTEFLSGSRTLATPNPFDVAVIYFCIDG